MYTEPHKVYSTVIKWCTKEKEIDTLLSAI